MNYVEQLRGAQDAADKAITALDHLRLLVEDTSGLWERAQDLNDIRVLLSRQRERIHRTLAQESNRLRTGAPSLSQQLEAERLDGKLRGL